MWRSFFAVAGCFVVSHSAYAEAPPYWPPAYSAKPIRGTVADAATDHPLEGVIVVAQWILYEATVGGQNPHKRLQVLETVTAKDGTYAFPGWGPKPNPQAIDTARGYFCCFLGNRDPQLNFFKPGYTPKSIQNEQERNTSERLSEWDGKTIYLGKFTGSLQEWAKELHFLQSDLSWGSQLDWRTCLRMVLAIEDQRLQLPYRTEWSVSGLESLGTSRETVLLEMKKYR